MPVIVINADDFGLTDGVCKSIVTLLEAGAISNTTIMMASEGAIPRAEAHNIRSFASYVGVHLQLAGGRPLSPIADVPSLTDAATGTFLDKGAMPTMKPEEVELEWTRQIDAAIDLLGTMPSHLDTHHGAHRVSQLTPVYRALAERYRVPVRGGTSLGQIPLPTSGGSAIALNQWTGHGSSASELKALMLDTALSLSPVDILEVVTHPGFCDEHLIGVSRLNVAREADHEALLSLAREDWFTAMQLQLVRYPTREPVRGKP